MSEGLNERFEDLIKVFGSCEKELEFVGLDSVAVGSLGLRFDGGWKFDGFGGFDFVGFVGVVGLDFVVGVDDFGLDSVEIGFGLDSVGFGFVVGVDVVGLDSVEFDVGVFGNFDCGWAVCCGVNGVNRPLESMGITGWRQVPRGREGRGGGVADDGERRWQ
jgi:hypothetical protein